MVQVFFPEGLNGFDPVKQPTNAPTLPLYLIPTGLNVSPLKISINSKFVRESDVVDEKKNNSKKVKETVNKNEDIDSDIEALEAELEEMKKKKIEAVKKRKEEEKAAELKKLTEELDKLKEEI